MSDETKAAETSQAAESKAEANAEQTGAGQPSQGVSSTGQGGQGKEKSEAKAAFDQEGQGREQGQDEAGQERESEEGEQDREKETEAEAFELDHTLLGFESPEDPGFQAWDNTVKELELTKAQAEGLMETYREQYGELIDAQAKAIKDSQEQLKAEWGEGFSANLDAATLAAKKLGGDAFMAEAKAVGYFAFPALTKAFFEASKHLAESDEVTGAKAGGKKSPAEVLYDKR